jgi:hypothetical protein
MQHIELLCSTMLDTVCVRACYCVLPCLTHTVSSMVEHSVQVCAAVLTTAVTSQQNAVALLRSLRAAIALLTACAYTVLT